MAVTETFTAGPTGTAVTLAPAAAVIVSAPTTTITLAGCVAGTTAALAAIGAPAGGLVIPAGTTLVTTAGPGSFVTCRIDLNDAGVGVLGTTVASGIVTVSLSGGTTAIVGAPALSSPGGGPASILGATSSIRCGALGSGPAVAEGCDFVDVSFTTTATTALGTLGTLNVSYVSDLPLINTNAQNAFVNFFTLVQGVGLFVQPALSLTCTSNTVVSTFGQVPGPIGGTTSVGFGLLPSAVNCSVVPVPARAAPGTIEISSVNGALLDAAGRVTTNLRIACDNATTFTPGINFDPNTCAGVQFAVLGSGVGFVEIRARYEPTTVAAAAGIREVETAGNVAFLAPPVNVNLLLDPNPVAVGATGVATARFNRTLNCAVASLGTATTAIDLCVNPTTGLPIGFNTGSALNGTVLYTIDNSAIASFAGAAPFVSSTGVVTAGSTQGFTTNANQASVRCGPFGTSTSPLTVGGFSATGGIGSNPFGSFFGGCESTTVSYRGVAPGATNITATFLPDLPGAFGTSLSGLSANVSGLIGQFGLAAGSLQSQTRVLEVIGTLPSSRVALTRGCNNVTPTVTESASAYAARVTPGGALVSIFEYQAATNTFRGFSPQAGAPSDLAGVTFLRPVFVCTNAAAELDQPPVAGQGGVGSGGTTTTR